MINFGTLKSKLLKKLSETYSSENKKEMKKILGAIKENKDFKEMYLFYEDIENMELSYPDSAQLYVETVEPILVEKAKAIKGVCEKIYKFIGDTDYEKNELYECLDVLSEKSNLTNIDKKVIAKKKLIEHLNTKKESKKEEQTVFTENEHLLHSVLANNFNVLFNNTLDESSRNELRTLLSMSDTEVNDKVKELSENITTKVDTILNEEKDQMLHEKLTEVKNEVTKMKPTKYNYFRLKQLENGLI